MRQAFKSEDGSGWYFQETQESNASRKQSIKHRWCYTFAGLNTLISNPLIAEKCLALPVNKGMV